MNPKNGWLFGLFLLALAGLSACSRPVPIGNLSKNPRDYDNKTITISGTVKERSGLILANSFLLADNTGTIRVLTDRPLPNLGDKVRVKGKVEGSFSLGSRQRLVFREEPSAGSKP